MKTIAILATIAIILMVVSPVSAFINHKNNCAHDVIGDINDDGQVSILDVSVFASTNEKQVGDTGYRKEADLNCDNMVNYKDLAILQLGWNLFYDYLQYDFDGVLVSMLE